MRQEYDRGIPWAWVWSYVVTELFVNPAQRIPKKDGYVESLTQTPSFENRTAGPKFGECP